MNMKHKKTWIFKRFKQLELGDKEVILLKTIEKSILEKNKLDLFIFKEINMCFDMKWFYNK